MRIARTFSIPLLLAATGSLCLGATTISLHASATACCGQSLVAASDSVRAEMLRLSWTGTITDPMSECILGEFEKAKSKTRRVVLHLDSKGGDLGAADRTIAALKKIRETHYLETMVSPGGTCGSACVLVFLAGQRRWGALTSSWLFHEVGRWTDPARTSLTTDREKTERVFQDYFLPAGVSETWLRQLRPLIQHSDYWQTGQNLWEDKSGIITHPIGNLAPRSTERRIY
jgi:hypothetical protein